MRTTPQKDKSVKIRMSQAEKDLLFQGAANAGVSLADFMRSHALAAAKQSANNL